MAIDVTAAFRGITTPLNELYNQIHVRGWTVKDVSFKNGSYLCKIQNPHGESVERVGPDPSTAVGAALIYLIRREHVRGGHRLAMWGTTWTDKLEQVAKAYAQAPVFDPKAAGAWKELADDSVARSKVLAQQIQIEITDEPEPYQTSAEMAEDVHKNRKFKVSRANSHHPIWTVDQNVAFRIVHDILGHCVAGGDFGWQGENLACAAHFPLLTPNAQKALFTECIGQTAYGAFYRSFGPQKVAFLDEYLEPVQSQENPPGHAGLHPTQSIAPTGMPQAEPSPSVGLDKGYVAPHMEGLGLTPVLTKNAGVMRDPNYAYDSGEPPLPLHQQAFLGMQDPLGTKGLRDVADRLDTGWHSWTTPDGKPDLNRMKAAIVNAFRVVLLSPRKNLRWNAIHYQHIQSVPHHVTDPNVYWDHLEKARTDWNVNRGFPADSHIAYSQFVPQVAAWLWKQQGEHDHVPAQYADEAKALLRQWYIEEEEKVLAKKPDDDGELVQNEARKALLKRLKLILNIKPQKRLDVEKPRLFEAAYEQGDTPAGAELPPGTTWQENMLTNEADPVTPDQDKYGAFMGTQLKSVAQISMYAEDLLEAALEDVRNHDGAGHHFRQMALRLASAHNIKGVGPKVVSFAWLLLQPLTSQLATIDVHMMDVLGKNYEKEMNDRDYFKFERELSARRDASGYSHVPLGQFQWGMWDHKRTGPGTHQDHSAMRVENPTHHFNIDWNPPLTQSEWTPPSWWTLTEPAGERAAADYDATVGAGYPRSMIPYRDDPVDVHHFASNPGDILRISLVPSPLMQRRLKNFYKRVSGVGSRAEVGSYQIALAEVVGASDPDVHAIIGNLDGMEFRAASVGVTDGILLMKFESKNFHAAQKAIAAKLELRFASDPQIELGPATLIDGSIPPLPFVFHAKMVKEAVFPPVAPSNAVVPQQPTVQMFRGGNPSAPSYPVIYAPDDNMIYVGGPGTYHNQLRAKFNSKKAVGAPEHDAILWKNGQVRWYNPPADPGIILMPLDTFFKRPHTLQASDDDWDEGRGHYGGSRSLGALTGNEKFSDMEVNDPLLVDTATTPLPDPTWQDSHCMVCGTKTEHGKKYCHWHMPLDSGAMGNPSDPVPPEQRHAAKLQVVHLANPDDEGVHGGGAPIIHSPQDNKVYVGSQGDFHWDLIERDPTLQARYGGRMGPPSLSKGDHHARISGGSGERWVNWYRPNPEGREVEKALMDAGHVDTLNDDYGDEW